MRRKAQRRCPTFHESLEQRRLLASAGQLLAYDFNSTTAWPGAAAVGTPTVTGTAAQSNVGTIDTEHGTTADRTGGENFTVTAAPASGLWRSEFTSGKLAITNTETNLGKLTLGFSLSASQARTVKVRVISYDAAGQYIGALETEISPAVVDSFQRFTIDLSTMNASGPGTFNPTAPKISFNFEIGSQTGWSASGSPTLRVDNVNYSKPALYVSSIDGKDTDNGTTEALAFATIQKAINAAQPGDIIDIKGDTAHPYTVSAGGRNLITKGGTPVAWVTIKNYPGQSPLLTSEGWADIQIGNYNPSTAAAIGYVEIRGLHFQGASAKVGSRSAPDGAYDTSPQYAALYGPYAKYIQPVDAATGTAGQSPAGTGADSRTNGNGLSIDGGNELNKPHDIRFADNLVEDFAGGGIGAGDSDRIQFENNTVRDNCYWDKYATSGISILSWYSFDATSGTTTRLIRGNISSGNIHKEEWVRDDPVLTQYSDGNGIIIDYNHSRDNTSVVDDRTLVTDNVVFDNGGSGIHSYNSNHVDIVNNTAYLNSASPYLQYGQIFSQGTDTKIYNNIMVAPVADTAAGEKPEPVNGGSRPSASNTIVYKNNVYFGGNSNALNLGGGSFAAAWPSDSFNVANVTADPKFANATVNSALADFRLQSTSPAISKGLVSTLVPQKDLLGNVRNGTTDSGAYEYYPSAPTVVSPAATTPLTNTTALLGVVAGDDNGSSGLTYTWSVTASPTGAAAPTFDTNGTATSKNAVVTFLQAGNYTLLVTVKDANNLTATSSVAVVAAQSLAGLTITPANAVVAAGGTQQYGVSGVDQFGQPMAAGSVSWSTAGAGTSIDTNGLLSASSTLGSFVVTATGSGLGATASGNVTDQTAPTLQSAVSRKAHGTAGTFDLLLNLASPAGTVEPRRGGASAVVFTFDEPVKALDGTLDANDFTITGGTFGSATTSGNTLTLNLTGLTDASRVTVVLSGVSDIAGNGIGGDRDVAARQLLGDVNGSGRVDIFDQQAVKNGLLQPITIARYLLDLDESGSINIFDQQLVKNNLLHVLN